MTMEGKEKDKETKRTNGTRAKKGKKSSKKSSRSKSRKKWKTRKIINIVVSVIFFLALLGWLSPATFNKLKSLVGADDLPFVTSSDYHGIDVSKHQGKIDWPTVAKDKDIQFVYIKATEGRALIDKRYRTNISQARKAGLKVGSYHFFTSNRTAREQFENFRRNVRRNEQDLIPMIDIEESGCRGASRAQLQKSLSELIDLMYAEYGKYPLIYSQYRFYNEKLAPEFNKYFIFMARYSASEPVLRGVGKHNIWQYTEKGKIKGIKGHVDLDRFVNGTSFKDIKL